MVDMGEMLLGAIAITVGAFFIGALGPTALTQITDFTSGYNGTGDALLDLLVYAVILGFIFVLLNPVISSWVEDFGDD